MKKLSLLLVLLTLVIFSGCSTRCKPTPESSGCSQQSECTKCKKSKCDYKKDCCGQKCSCEGTCEKSREASPECGRKDKACTKK